jgi:hypothetical protein
MATNDRRGQTLRHDDGALPASVWLDEPGDGRFGTHHVQGWMLNDGRYAVQVRGIEFSKAVRGRKGATLWADALTGNYLQVWLVPVENESEGRKIVLDLLALSKAESSPEITIHRQQSNPKKSGHLDREGESTKSAGHTNTPEILPSREWFDERGCFGVSICCAFQRERGSHIFQVADPRLFKLFGRRKGAELKGTSAGCFGPLRQYQLPIGSKTKAVRIIKAALATLPDWEGET